MIEGKKTQYQKDAENLLAYKGILEEPEKDIMVVLHFNMSESLKRIADSLEIISSFKTGDKIPEAEKKERRPQGGVNPVSNYDKDYEDFVAYQVSNAAKEMESAWPLFQRVIHYVRCESLKRVADSLEKLA